MEEENKNSHLMNSTKYTPTILAKAPIGIIAFLSDWKIDFVNDVFVKYANLYQFESEQLEGSSILEINLFPDIDIRSEIESIKNGLLFEKIVKTISTVDGGMIVLIAKVTPIFDESNFAGGILIVEDIKVPSSLLRGKNLREEQIESILNNVNDILLLTDETGTIKYFFGKLLNRLDFNITTLTNSSLNKAFPDSLELFNSFNLAVSQKRIEKIISTIKINEENFTFETRIEPITNWQGQIQLVYVFFDEISDLVKEKNLLKNEIDELKQYQVITDAISDAFFAVDSEGKIFFWNKAAEALFGYSRSEVYGKFFGKVLDVFDSEYFGVIKEELDKNITWKITLNVYKKDGQKEIIDAKFSKADNGSETILILCTNITERALKEQSLKASKEKYKEIINNSFDLICSIDIDGFIKFASPSFYKTLKYSKPEVINKKFTEFISPSFLKDNKFDLKSIDSSQREGTQLVLVTKNHEEVFCTSIFSPVYEKNKIISYNGILSNITKTKVAQKNLQIFQSMFNAFQEGVAVECEGKIIMTNKIFPSIFGYENENEIVGKDIVEFISSNDFHKVLGYFDLASQQREIPSRFEFMAKRKDNINFYAEMSLSWFKSENKNYFVIVAQDITERKRVQQAIRDSEEKYRNVTENIDDFLFNYDRIENILRPVFYTASVEKITGYTQMDFMSDSKFILKIIYPDDFYSLKKKLIGLFKSKIQLSGEFEFRIINRHGNVVWVRTKLNLIRNNEGEIQKIYGLVSDISSRKKAEDELIKSTENLIKSNETKDRFISIISHDLRTPFSSILGFTDLLLSDNDLSEMDRRQYIEFIQESSKSMLSLVNSLLDWTRLQTGRIRFEPERIEIHKIIEQSLNTMFGVAFQKNIEIISNISEDVFVYADKDLILQVFNNLLSNAIKFTPKNGSIIISVSPSDKIRFLEFSVKDSGMGVAPENIGKLFRVDTKFTSEGTEGEKGTGLGLSLVKEIIEKHGGSIRVESILGEGANFKFTLPIASANILLVDDSKTDRLLYSKILKNITPDYNIEIASDGKEALEKILLSPPALIITDHIMPNMNGYQLVLELKKAELKGKPPIIVLSSNLDRNTIEDYQSLGIEYVFQKPVNLTSFKNAVEKSLRRGLLSG